MTSQKARDSSLIVARVSPRDIKMRDVLLFVDDVRVATIRYGQCLKIPVSAGRHTLKATNTVRSQTARFEVSSGKSVAFATGNLPSGCFMFVLAVAGAGPPSILLEPVSADESDAWKPKPI